MKNAAAPSFLLALVLLAVAVVAEAQQPKKIPLIGYLSGTSAAGESARAEGIRSALRVLGRLEGQNIASEYRYAEGKRERLPEVAAELVRLKVDVIVVAGGGPPTIEAAKNATKTIPIVMTGSSADPVAAGFVGSLARPGGNITGLSALSQELDGKGWSCSKKPFPKLPVSRCSTVRPVGAVYSM